MWCLRPIKQEINHTENVDDCGAPNLDLVGLERNPVRNEEMRSEKHFGARLLENTEVWDTILPSDFDMPRPLPNCMV